MPKLDPKLAQIRDMLSYLEKLCVQTPHSPSKMKGYTLTVSVKDEIVEIPAKIESNRNL